MFIIYFDNFRGFEKTFLPIKKINFFVGENSTGKTSVLKLIKIISDINFWFTFDFNLEHVELGYFNEIVNFNSKNKDFFEIGYGFEENKKIYGLKMRFYNFKGLPDLREIFLVNKDINLQVLIDENEIKYKYSFDVNVNQSFTNFFRWWTNTDSLNKNSYKNFKRNKIIDGIFPKLNLPIILELIFEKIKKDNVKFNKFYYPFIKNPLFKKITWFAPIRTEPKRTYDNYKIDFKPDGTHTPYLLKSLINDNKNEDLKKSIIKFGLESGLFEEIKINNLGNEETSPFEMLITLNGNPIRITNVGYGVSQILPIIAEIASSKKGHWFAIQQPEIHLHPKAQSAFGEFIFNQNILENKNFLIETHSDFIIDRYRIKMHEYYLKNKISPESQIVFFQRTRSSNKLECIEINPDGSLPEQQPKEYREFFIKEKLDLLKI